MVLTTLTLLVQAYPHNPFHFLDCRLDFELWILASIWVGMLVTTYMYLYLVAYLQVFAEHVSHPILNIFGQFFAQLTDNILHIQMTTRGQQHIGQFVVNNIYQFL